MANELNLSLSPAQTGLTVTAILIQANAQVGSSISCPESSTVAGHYSGNMPAISAGVYGVNFLSSGQLIGSGSIDWDGTKEKGLVDLPTVAQVEARTLPSAEYFVVGDYTAPPTAIANALAVRTELSTELGRIDAAISSRSTYDGSDTFGTVTLLERLTALRASYLDKLNVTGTLAHSDAAATYRADVSGLLTSAAYISSLPANFGDLAITATSGLVTSTNAGSGASAAEVWGYVTRTLTSGGGGATPAEIWNYTGRSLDGTQAAALTSILEDTSTTIPGLIAALPTLAQVQAAGFTTTRNDALISIEAYTRPMAKQLGLVSGISTTHSPTAIVVSDGDGSTTITDNGGGSYTVALT